MICDVAVPSFSTLVLTERVLVTVPFFAGTVSTGLTGTTTAVGSSAFFTPTDLAAAGC